MQKKIKPITASDYKIVFGQSGYDELNRFIAIQKYSKIFLITDTNSNEFCSTIFFQYLETNCDLEIIEFENGESNKNITTCVEIWKTLTELGGDRKSLIINIGGGVVSDLGGFVASTFKRGIDFINIPTTLLAMVDAAVGGKNGVDLGVLKNQIGTITNPKLVVIDSDFLATLSKQEMRSGLAEMLKHGLIFDRDYWKKFATLATTDSADLDLLIYESIVIKNTIVTKDPTENGIRKALNFGHTLGHAIESYFLENQSKTKLLHGEAIAIGMVLESFISLQKGFLSQEEYVEIKNTISNIFDKIAIETIDVEPIIDLLIHDKKNEYGLVHFVLLNGIGNTTIDQIAENEIITKAFAAYNI